MDTPSTAFLDYASPATPAWLRVIDSEQRPIIHQLTRTIDEESLRQCGWEIGERKPVESYLPAENHVGLAMVAPAQGFAHWRIKQEWIDQTAYAKGEAWHHCRLVLRVYDVSFIIFTGLNANRVQDVPIPSICGQVFFGLPRPGTFQIAEVGFVLRNGEFLAAARSPVVHFATDTFSPRGDHAALLVDEGGRVEEIGNLWEQERVLQERRRPRLRSNLRIATFALAALNTGQDGPMARFVTELAAGQCEHGHDVHVFLPASGSFDRSREIQGVTYEPLVINPSGDPMAVALDFARAAEKRLRDDAPFDLFHLHEWMTGLAPWIGSRPTVLSLNSIEATRRNGCAPSPLSLEIQQVEREVAHSVDCILTPDWLREQARDEFGVRDESVLAFPMEARLPNEWNRPLDYGQVKKEIGLGPLDRLLLYVGPLEHAGGADLLVDALPTVLNRANNVRVAIVGLGDMYNHLQYRSHQLGVAHAVRLLGHREGPPLSRLVRSAEALVVPSRYRMPGDDGVIGLARRAAKPVITTHSGPAHLVKHEETGIITFDNPGSMVWAIDRILSDASHAEQMGRAGRHSDNPIISWNEVARIYLELCAECFPELRMEA